MPLCFLLKNVAGLSKRLAWNVGVREGTKIVWTAESPVVPWALKLEVYKSIVI